MPKERLNVSQIMTMGANELPIFDVPSGWMTKRSTKIPHVVPMMVELVMVGTTTLSPWMAPSTDCAGVRTPSNLTISEIQNLHANCELRLGAGGLSYRP